jgi:alkylation response protein AidB-like acyl-CoA dehydrogenase
MTFELSPEHQAARERARAFAADIVRPAAADIDRMGRVPDAIVTAEGLALADADLLALAVMTEEIAVASASAALSAALGAHGDAGGAGLRGAPVPDRSARAQVVLTAVALGVGRAALDQALAQLRDASAHPGGEEKPHWAVADVATELEAARLLAFKAAASHAGDRSEVEIAMARLMATSGAGHAVDVALRLGGSDAFAAGSTLERLARDARAVALVAGGEEALRAVASAGLLPG